MLSKICQRSNLKEEICHRSLNTSTFCPRNRLWKKGTVYYDYDYDNFLWLWLLCTIAQLCMWFGNRGLKQTIIVLAALKWYGVEMLSRYKITRLKKDILANLFSPKTKRMLNLRDVDISTYWLYCRPEGPYSRSWLYEGENNSVETKKNRSCAQKDI